MGNTARVGRGVPGSGARTLVAALSLAVLLAEAVPAEAHQRRHSAGAETLSVASRDSAPGAAAADSAHPRAGPTGALPFVMPPARDALLEHPHNKLVHFPLGVAVAAALLLLLGRRRPGFDAAGRCLVWFAALGGLAAYLTGRIQKQAFEGEPKEWLARLHERWGLATAIVLVAWALLTLWKPGRRHAWLLGIVAAALVLITGFYGGVVAHGE